MAVAGGIGFRAQSRSFHTRQDLVGGFFFGVARERPGRLAANRSARLSELPGLQAVAGVLLSAALPPGQALNRQLRLSRIRCRRGAPDHEAGNAGFCPEIRCRLLRAWPINRVHRSHFHRRTVNAHCSGNVAPARRGMGLKAAMRGHNPERRHPDEKEPMLLCYAFVH